MKKKVIAISFIALLSACGQREPKEIEPESRPVKFYSVHVGTQDNYRSFPAVVEPGDKAVLAFRVSGKIASISARPGETVTKGQQLAQLEQDRFLLQVEQAQAQYELTLVQFKRDKKLFKKNVVSELDFDTAEAKLNQAKAALDKEKTNLDYSTLVAPYSGKLSLLLNENHEYVEAKQTVMNIQSADFLNIVFQLPDQLVPSLHKSNDIRTVVMFDTFPDDVFPAQFKEIDTEANSTSSSYKVTLFIEKPKNKNILPGMSGVVKIKLPTNQDVGIPEQAIIREGDKTFIWYIDNDNTTHKKSVELDSKNQVISGLESGDNIAITGISQLVENQKVRSWVKERGL